MRVGMTLPVMEPALDRAVLERWTRSIDEGPWSSVCFGERICFDNPETLTLLGAVGAWTRRVRVVTTVVVPQLHDPVHLAKALATGDLLCDGRLTVGFGVGGRTEDYRAVGADPATRTIGEMAERIGVMRRVWAGEDVTGGRLPVGPPPVQPGGPELLIGTLGPKTVRAAAAWADGLAGMSLDLDLAQMSALFDRARSAWAEAARPAPRLTTSFWFALTETVSGADPRRQVGEHLRRYMNWMPTELVDGLVPVAGFAGPVEELREVLDRIAELGTDEVQLVPTSADPRQVELVAEVLR
ncbi:LLM class flavin-dependent oxidoreductase [Nocardioides daejeonensis]|uniref:LLM class flavin-dependent oxidoreductase n=1 Tax=Nocardioides daejeonensis TaxID=1046556 RepID=UPI001952694F|nr:LLM class flavin-dependent oxidoreductase [Nocardioides daejeonensis]